MKKSACQAEDPDSILGGCEDPLEKVLPTQDVLKQSHGQRTYGYSPWGHSKSQIYQATNTFIPCMPPGKPKDLFSWSLLKATPAHSVCVNRSLGEKNFCIMHISLYFFLLEFSIIRTAFNHSFKATQYSMSVCSYTHCSFYSTTYLLLATDCFLLHPFLDSTGTQ